MDFNQNLKPLINMILERHGGIQFSKSLSTAIHADAIIKINGIVVGKAKNIVFPEWIREKKKHSSKKLFKTFNKYGGSYDL